MFEASKGRLRVVGRAGVGIDNVDLTAASENGCLVVNAPTANTVAAAEHGISLLTALARNVAQADASMKAGKWDRTTYVGVSVVGKTLAIIGFGKVGTWWFCVFRGAVTYWANSLLNLFNVSGAQWRAYKILLTSRVHIPAGGR